MTRLTTQEHYQRRFEVLVDYIFRNLNGRLDLDTLAEVACISPYHLHRLYRCRFGETLADTVRRLRLHYAAEALLTSDTRMELIAREAGYGSVQAFSRSFRAAFGMPPATFRNQGTVMPFELSHRPSEDADFSVRLVRLEATTVRGLPHSGSFMDIGQSFERLFVRLAAGQRLHPGVRLCGLYWDDPDSVPAERLRSLAGGIGMDGAGLEALESHTLPAGDYAVLRFTGPYNHLHRAYQWLFGHWLPRSGRWPGDAPVMEEYLNNPREVPPSDLLTDIYLPVVEESSRG